jgi:hypothetical protein
MHDTHNHYYGDPAIEQKLDRILQLLEHGQEREMAILDTLTADVTANTSAVASTVQLVTNIVAQLKALQAQGTVDPAALSQLTTQLESNNAALAAAVVANTISAPPAGNASGGAASQASAGAAGGASAGGAAGTGSGQAGS